MKTGDFKILKKDSGTKARRGRLMTAHGPVETPVFMPVGTQATVKAMSPQEMESLGCKILLGNTYYVLIFPLCRCYVLVLNGLLDCPYLIPYPGCIFILF